MNIETAIRKASLDLKRNDIENSLLDSEILMSKVLKKDRKFIITSITESKILNKKISGFKLQINSKKAFKNAQVIIDFSTPKCTLEILKIASKLKKRVVIGTTGFTQK